MPTGPAPKKPSEAAPQWRTGFNGAKETVRMLRDVVNLLVHVQSCKGQEK